MQILVRGTNWIGDAVMTIPAIRELRRLFPEVHLTLLTRASTAEVFRDSGIFDEIIIARSVLNDVRELRRRRFDLAVIFPNSFDSALTVRLAGVNHRFGYAAQHRSMLLSDAIEVPEWKNTRHEVYYYVELVREVGKKLSQSASTVEASEPRVSVGPEMRDRARAALRELGIEPGGTIVVIAPGSTNSRAKRWTPERFATLNDRLQKELDVAVILMGSPDDKEVSDLVSELSDRKPFDLTGSTDIALAAAVLSEVDLLISNDMGLAHLAPAVGTETFVIFGPTNPATTRPFSDRATVITANVECSPCMLRDCPIDHRCMTRVSPDDVFERARVALKK